MRPSSRTRPLALAALAGALYAAAQPDRGAWPLAAVCLVPLLLAFRGRGLAARAGLGALAGGVAGAALVLHPTGVALARYFAWSAPLGYAGAFALSLLHGALPFAGFGALAGDPARGSAVRGVARVGAALVVAEGVRSVLLPWGLFAYALAPVPWLAGGASLGGAALLGFALAALNAAWLRSPRLAACLLLALALPGLASRIAPGAPGSVTVADASTAPREDALRARLVQGSLPAEWRRDPRRVRDALARLAAAGAGPRLDLAVWPESALVAPVPENLPLLAETPGALDGAAFLLLGAPRTEASEGESRLFNSAVLVDGAGQLLAAHDKTRLVPVAETRRETPGKAPRALALGASPERRLGALVCYELLFADVARALVRDGAGALVNLSNDEWFGTTRGIEQHFAAAAIRAIETRRPLLRATNTGITAALDASGRVVARLAPGAPGALVVDVVPAAALTPAVRFGDWVLWLCLAGLAVDAWLHHRNEAALRQLS